LPAAGPTKDTLIDQAVKDGKVRFEVIDVNDTVIDTLLARPPESLHSRFGTYGAPPAPTINIGDTVSVTIWEAGGGNLFGESLPDRALSGGSRGVTIPEQIVANDGAISIPFAGRVPVRGRTALQVAREIERRLSGKAMQPQVIVAVPKSVANTVTVSGEVVNGARVPLSPKGDHLLDMIASAGGARAPVYETYVRLSRNVVTATIPLQTLINNPTENIYAWPGDVLTLVRVPQSFEAFGATGKNAQITFDQEKLTLVQAIAKSSGLLDERADPAGIFLFRLEPETMVRALRPAADSARANAPLPVVYHLDLSDAKSYFLAQRFPIEDKDILYVANASSNELQKFFQLLGTLTAPVVTGILVNNSAP